MDWTGAEHLDLEAASRHGPIIVAKEDERYSVLARCTVQGAYGYDYLPGKGVHREEISFETEEDLRAWLPFRPVHASVSFSEEEFVGLAMLTVGSRRLRHLNRSDFGGYVSEVKSESLVGGQLCAGATHYVSAIYVGAFRSLAIKKMIDKAALETLLFGVSGERTESARSLRTQGIFAACGDDDAGGQNTDEQSFYGAHVRAFLSSQPRRGCQFAIRVDLASIDRMAERDEVHEVHEVHEDHEVHEVHENPSHVVHEEPAAELDGPTGWTIQAATHGSIEKARDDTQRFKDAGLGGFWFAQQGNLGVVLIGSYSTPELAESDARTASRVTGTPVNIVSYPRWCPARESFRGYDRCSIWGVMLQFTTSSIQEARAEQTRRGANGHPCEILKHGPVYRLSRGPFLHQSEAVGVAIEEGLGAVAASHLDKICPARRRTPEGYFECGTAHPRSRKVDATDSPAP